MISHYSAVMTERASKRQKTSFSDNLKDTLRELDELLGTANQNLAEDTEEKLDTTEVITAETAREKYPHLIVNETMVDDDNSNPSSEENAEDLSEGVDENNYFSAEESERIVQQLDELRNLVLRKLSEKTTDYNNLEDLYSEAEEKMFASEAKRKELVNKVKILEEEVASLKLSGSGAAGGQVASLKKLLVAASKKVKAVKEKEVVYNKTQADNERMLKISHDQKVKLEKLQEVIVEKDKEISFLRDKFKQLDANPIEKDSEEKDKLVEKSAQLEKLLYDSNQELVATKTNLSVRVSEVNMYKEKLKSAELSLTKSVDTIKQLDEAKTENERKTKQLTALNNYKKNADIENFSKTKKIDELEKAFSAAQISSDNTKSQYKMYFEELEGKTKKLFAMVEEARKANSKITNFDPKDTASKSRQIAHVVPVTNQTKVSPAFAVENAILRKIAPTPPAKQVQVTDTLSKYRLQLTPRPVAVSNQVKALNVLKKANQLPAFPTTVKDLVKPAMPGLAQTSASPPGPVDEMISVDAPNTVASGAELSQEELLLQTDALLETSLSLYMEKLGPDLAPVELQGKLDFD